MKKKEIKSWRAKSEAELKVLIEKLIGEVVDLKVKLQTGKLKNVKGVTAKRHELAVAKTLLTEKKILNDLGKEDKK
ncbi:50S ribosomal protein L29 [Patescibacteria group bacterium]|nr:50S ribosomal protein L29 [Patescibacteria group bacterium]